MLSIDRAPARRAFALGGSIMLLFLLLIAVMAVRSYLLWSAMPASPPRGAAPFGHTSDYSTGMKIGIWAAPIVAPLIVLGIAWVVGWLVSLMFGKSDDAGTIGAAVVMLGALALFGYGTYGTLAASKNPPQPPPQATNPLTQRPPPPEPAPSPPAAPNPIPVTPQQPTATPTPPPSPTPRPSPRPLVPTQQPAFDAQPVLAEAQKTLDASVADVVTKADALLPLLAKPYPHEIRVLNERLAEIEALRISAGMLSAGLESAPSDARARLIAAGCPADEAQSVSFRWAHMTYRTGQREFGAEAILRLCDKAKAEAEHLRDNIAKWTVDAKGRIKSNDTAFKTKAESNRFFVRTDAERRDHIKEQLHGR